MVYEEIDAQLQQMQRVTEPNSVVLEPGQVIVTLPLCAYCQGPPSTCKCGRPQWHLNRSVEPDQPDSVEPDAFSLTPGVIFTQPVPREQDTL